jgi:hypothetical protein
VLSPADGSGQKRRYGLNLHGHYTTDALYSNAAEDGAFQLTPSIEQAQASQALIHLSLQQYVIIHREVRVFEGLSGSNPLARIHLNQRAWSSQF